MNNPMNIFNNAFTPIKEGLCQIALNSGRIAIQCSDGTYKTWNEKQGRLTNVTNFCMNMPTAFYIAPTCNVYPGDIIFEGKKPKCVMNVHKTAKGKVDYIEVVDYEENEIKKIIPVRHVLMGSVYFYRKIVNIFAGMFGGMNGMKGKGFFGKMLQFQAMSMFMGGMNGQGTQDAQNPMGNMMQMMGPMCMMQMMGNMFNGNEASENFFDSLDLGLNFNVNEAEETEESDEGEEETPKPKKASSKKKK